MSSIFNGIKSIFETYNATTLPYSIIEASILKKGFTAIQLLSCFDDYEQLGVISMSADKTHVIMEQY